MIKLAQIMKDRTYPESGSVLYDSIAPLLTRDEKVALDLDGVIALPSMFLNASIGMAANEFGADVVKKNVVFTMCQRPRLSGLKSILRGCKGIHDLSNRRQLADDF